METTGLLCWNCGRPTGIEHKVARNDSCPHCLADLRCCRGCRHFDPTRRFQCKEKLDRNIVEKEKSNFCDFYQMRTAMKRPGGVSTATRDNKSERKDRFDDLFKD